MKKNEKVQVSPDHPLHPNRIGYFQFAGQGKNENIGVLSERPTRISNLFAINLKDVKPIP